jgi:type VII secretion-associated serine protease mycosin
MIMNAPPQNDAVRDSQWHLDFLDIQRAHGITTGGGATVAIVDSGVDANHPDLAGTFTSGVDLTSEAVANGLADIDGHGSKMAGVVAAHGRALGIAPAAKIMSVRTTVGVSLFGLTARGVDWAVDHGAHVICIAGGQAPSSALQEAIARALNANIVVVAAAGNTPEDSAVTYPAAYPGVIAAAGVGRDGNHASVSVTGAEVVLAAPAVDIVGPTRVRPGESGYSSGTGTSDATAIIAGAAALVRSKFPNLSAAEVVHRLTATADDKGPPGRDIEYGYGVVNIVKALTADVPPLQSATATQALPSPSTPAAPAKGRPLGVLGVAGLFILALAIAFGAWRRLRRD